MTQNSEPRAEILRLIELLAAEDGPSRERSRTKLVQLGTTEVAQELVSTLVDPRRIVRWEAAKALRALADPVAAVEGPRAIGPRRVRR